LLSSIHLVTRRECLLSRKDKFPIEDGAAKISLNEVIGGHPYLIGLAFCHLVTRNNDINQLIAEATTDSGIYRDYLRGFLITFRQHPKLADAFKQVIHSEYGIVLNSIIAY